MDDKKLSLHEKWAADIQSYQKGAHVKTAVPQCEKCAHFIKGNALHCQKYVSLRKPKEVMFAHRECPEFSSNDILHIKITSIAQSRLFGGIFGFCVGDMLGVPVEFSTRQQRNEDSVNELRAYGTYHQPFGAWSDDTSLMLCLMDAMIENNSLDRLSKNMIGFYQKGMFTPNGVVFDIGNSTAGAIQRMIDGVHPTRCGGVTNMDNGNGSLMRILPLAFACHIFKDCEFIKLIEDVSSLTHAHPRSKLACIIYVHFASQLFAGMGKSEALDDSIRFVNEYCKPAYASEFRSYASVLNKKVTELDRESIPSSGYVVDTLEAVFWSFLNTTSYREAVLTAVNLGGDTDTIAALVGGLAGIYYGFSSIPSNWVQNIIKKHEIAELTTQFWQSIAV